MTYESLSLVREYKTHLPYGHVSFITRIWMILFGAFLSLLLRCCLIAQGDRIVGVHKTNSRGDVPSVRTPTVDITMPGEATIHVPRSKKTQDKIRT